MNDNIHKEHFLEIYSERPNYGKIENVTHFASLKNPVCEDVIDIELEVKDGRIINVGFTGGSCMISVVSSCVLLDNVKGMDVEDVLKLNKKDMDKWLGVDITPIRAKCELLALEVLKKCLTK